MQDPCACNPRVPTCLLNKSAIKMEGSQPERELPLVLAALQTYSRLLLKEDSSKIELDQLEGQEAFRQYMCKIEGLINESSAQCSSRAFRTSYTNAYKVLYQEDSLGYIPEIYDSAQEGFPFIYVNGEKYDFSPQVLTLGESLVESFYKMVHQLRVYALRGQQGVSGTRSALQEFDGSWTAYEQKYISELIRIETHSKSAIRLILQAEQALMVYEQQQRLAGRIFLAGPEYDNLRRQLCQKISRLNSVANIDGKGRDDLSVEVLFAAEKVVSTVTQLQSRSVRLLAEKIRESFENVREVLRFFGENFEMVDPQLKNNPQLVMALQQYECYWEKGKRYFLDPARESQLVAFSTLVDAASDKYPAFRQLLDCSDPSLFWTIPALVILRALEDEDEGLAQSFLSQPAHAQKHHEYLQLKRTYLDEKSRNFGAFCLYNQLEAALMQEGAKGRMDTLVLRVKQMGVSLERVSPSDWNDMLGVVLLE